MSDSLFDSLLATVDARGSSEIARRLGEPQQTVSRGLEAAIAAVIGGLARKAGDSGAMHQVFEIASKAPANFSWSSSIEETISGGRRFLSSLFGAGESALTTAVSRECGLRADAASTLIAIAAPAVLSALGKRIRVDKLTPDGLGSLLQRESESIQAPAGVEAPLISPVVAQAVRKDASVFSWPMGAALGALLFGLLWFFGRDRRPVTARIVPPASEAADTATREAADRPRSSVPAATEYVLLFDSGSAALRPESRRQLRNIAAALSANPDANLKVTGYTDNVGGAAQNLKLSRDRASSVVAGLTRLGVPASHLDNEGYGARNPVSDNATQEGRAGNRRVLVNVTQK